MNKPGLLGSTFLSMFHIWIAKRRSRRCIHLWIGGATYAVPFLLLVCSVAALAQSVGAPTVSVFAINVNATATVRITSRIVVPTLIPGSVNLQMLPPGGNVYATLGPLHDDGLNGDLFFGDSVYSGNFPVSASQTGKITLRVSVATRGTLLRTMSAPVTVEVLPTGIPVSLVAPDLSQIAADPITGNMMVTNEILACFSAGTTYGTIIAIGRLVNATLAGRFPGPGDCYQFFLPTGSTAATVNSAIAVLLRRPEVTAANPDFLRTPEALPTESDASYELLNLNNTHSFTAGDNVVVAILDTGIDYTNSALNPSSLSPRIIKGHDLTTTPPGTDPMDFVGHGTGVAGVLAATAPGARILAIKVLDQLPNGTWNGGCTTSTAGIYEALGWGANVRVINMSYSAPADPNNQNCPQEALAIGFANLANIVVVAAAGNQMSFLPRYPAAHPGVLSVGATDNTDQRGVWCPPHGSNYGSWVKVAAPGTDLVTTYLSGQTLAFTSGCSTSVAGLAAGTQKRYGTSFAAPFVAGTAALVAARHPLWSSSQIQNRLLQTAKSLPPALQLGSGRLDPFAAVGNRLSVSVSGPGVVQSSPSGIDCPTSQSACAASYGNETVTLTANPPTSVTWGGDCASAGTNATATVTLTNDKSCTAEFAQPATFLFDAVPGTGPLMVTSSTRWQPAHVCPESTCRDSDWYGVLEGYILAPAGKTFADSTVRDIAVMANDSYVRDYLFPDVGASSQTARYVKFYSAKDPPRYVLGSHCPTCVIVPKTGGVQAGGTIRWTGGAGPDVIDTIQFRDQQP